MADEEKQRELLLKAIMILGCLMLLIIYFVEDKSTVLQEIEIKPKIIGTETILKSSIKIKNEFEAKDSGYLWIHSSSAYFTSNNIFVYYVKQTAGDIVRKEIPFDFKIREDNISYAKLVTYQKMYHRKYCQGLLCSISEKRIKEKEVKGDTYQILYIPNGTLDKDVYDLE